MARRARTYSSNVVFGTLYAVKLVLCTPVIVHSSPHWTSHRTLGRHVWHSWISVSLWRITFFVQGAAIKNGTPSRYPVRTGAHHSLRCRHMSHSTEYHRSRHCLECFLLLPAWNVFVASEMVPSTIRVFTCNRPPSLGAIITQWFRVLEEIGYSNLTEPFVGVSAGLQLPGIHHNLVT